MNVEWDPRLEMGVAVIDQQHREIFRRLRILLAAMAEHRGRTELATLFEFMGDYFDHHFGAEEQLMIARDYPGYGPHKTQHEQFQRAYRQMEEQYRRDGSTVVTLLHVARGLTELFRDHINVTDRALATFVRGPARS